MEKSNIKIQKATKKIKRVKIKITKSNIISLK